MEKTMEKENMMGTMPEGRLLFKLAMPMIFSVLVSESIGSLCPKMSLHPTD